MKNCGKEIYKTGIKSESMKKGGKEENVSVSISKMQYLPEGIEMVRRTSG